MTANELRINNAVYCKYRSGHFLVKEIAESWLRIADPEKGYLYSESYETVVPIRLTWELLDQIGFKAPGHSKVQRLTIDYSDSDYLCTLQVSGSGMQVCRSGIGAICPEVFHLHELQNLVYSLTGTELKINFKELVK
jgi:hypothetical protein